MSIISQLKTLSGRDTEYLREASSIIDFRDASILCARGNKLEEKLLDDATNYDASNFAAVCSIVQPGAICFDIGANIGIYSAVMSVRVGDAGQVHAFEPVRHIRRKLAANVAMNGGRNVTINPFALGAAPGELEMFQIKQGEFRGGTSTFLNNNNVQDMGADKFDREMVEIRTLDGYAAEMARVDFLKIDVEGFELPVLQGARKTLTRQKPAILFEHDQPRLAGLGITEPDFAALFGELGYSIYEIVVRDGTTYFVPFAWNRKIKGNNLLALHLGQ